MKASRLAAWMVCAAVGGAWLASAAGVTRSPRISPERPRSGEDIRLDALAADVQAQAGRLRERLSNAPSPSAAQRNPFSFGMRPRPKAREALATAAPPVPPPPPEILEPSLTLIGIAETRTPDGVVRSAMITGGREDLMMVTAGQRLLSRYDVIAVGADAVELKDLETGLTRRLVLQ
jgi:hypothetical protein